MGRPKLLDLFGCEGGAGWGYGRAGWDVYGVDMAGKFAKRYPFAFRKDDALDVLVRVIEGTPIAFTHPDGSIEWVKPEEFAAVHTSPPCQGYTRGNAGRETNWPKLIPDVRALLTATGLPYVIENVKDAGPEMVDPVGLCGCMFDLSTEDTDGVTIHLQRLRLFETNWGMTAPRACDHSQHEWVAGAYGGARRDKYEARYVRKGGYVPRDKDVVKRLLGVEHDMTWNGLFECIPPAYSEHVGNQLLAKYEAVGREPADLFGGVVTQEATQ
jgi:DNA (cytosine-5)-methyltransferase 1